MVKMVKLEWITERRKISDLIPYEQNPRILTKKQADDLKKSLLKFNLVEIPVIDTRDRIIAGHQRLNIMQMIGRGEEEIEVRVPNRELTEKEFREYNIRSNKNLGEWDFDVLANSFDTSDLIEWGFEPYELDIEKALEGGAGDLPEKSEMLKPYRKTHVLLSFDPDILVDIADSLKAILAVPGVEYEQGSN
jgi:hypothetical protein